jgi:hypothetical protein
MPKREPPFHLGNLMILLNTFVGLSRLWLFPLIAIVIAIFLYSIIPSYRVAGACISGLAIVYGYCEEIVFASPQDMADEIYNDPTMQQMRAQPDSQDAIRLSDRILGFAARVHRFVLRTVQSAMGLSGLVIGFLGSNSQPFIDWVRTLFPFA